MKNLMKNFSFDPSKGIQTPEQALLCLSILDQMLDETIADLQLCGLLPGQRLSVQASANAETA